MVSKKNELVKVLTFAPMPPTITGGIEEYAYSVINELKKIGIQVTTVTSKFKDKATYPSDDYVYVRSFMLWKRPLPCNPFALINVLNAIRRSDVIHIHTPYPFLESIGAFFGKLFGKKVLITYHMDAVIDSDAIHEKKPFSYTIIENVYRIFSTNVVLSLCDIICTNTKAYALNSPMLRKQMKKIKVIYQGVRKDLFDFLDVKKAEKMRGNYLAQKYSHIVTFVGRLIPYKGLPYLIEAINILRDEKIFFIIGGNGPQKQFLINLVNSQNLKNVTFAGFVKDEDLFNLFYASDLVVAPSISELESTPISLLSAMYVGTPVIGTEIGGTAETIPNDKIHGKIIPIKNSKILAEAINSMLQNVKKNGDPKPRFWSDVAKDYQQIIIDLVARSK
jgi:glycosyltransferase involved in cell wall biosynthesis